MMKHGASHRRPRRERGFTLVEAVIATGILGLMGTLVFGTFSRAMNAREQAELLSRHYHAVRQAMLRMSREIQMAFVSENRDCDDPRTETIFRAKRASNGMRLDFTSFSHFKMHADANESDQNELSYYVDRHPDDPARTALFRREQLRIDDEPDEGGIEQVLCEDVTSLEFELYDAKEDRWEDEWDTEDRDFKDNLNRPRLPMFVRIEIKATAPGGDEETFVTKTRIFLRHPINIFGATVRCVD